MNNQGNLKQEKYAILPHQMAFIEQFFADPSKRGYLLQSDVGLGASYTTAHIIKRSVETQPNIRTLLLVPKLLRMQIQHVLASVGVSAEVVDRFSYRKLQDAAQAKDMVWREGGVYILSADFGKEEDIANSLSSVQWTLLVVDEAHLLRGTKMQVVKQIVASSPQLRIVLVTPVGVEKISAFGIGPFTKVRWRRREVMDQIGKPLPHTLFEVVEYQKGLLEHRIQKTVGEIAALIRESGLMSVDFTRPLASSPVALEDQMRKFQTRLMDKGPNIFLSGVGEEAADTEDLPVFNPKNSEAISTAIDTCLAELEAIEIDSKLNAFTKTLSAIQGNQTVTQPLCIVTQFRATLFYLQAHLEEVGISPYTLHGSMSFEKRMRNINEFRQHGGILLSTLAPLDEFSLPQVEVLTLYDSPRGLNELRKLYGQFQRWEREKPLRIRVFVEATSRNSENEILNNLQELFAEEYGE